MWRNRWEKLGWYGIFVSKFKVWTTWCMIAKKSNLKRDEKVWNITEKNNKALN